jgi:predicted RNA-binding protein with PUA-like domain
VGFWLFKQEPSSYNYTELESDGKTVWDGVTNNLALKHLRSAHKGDRVFFYHSGDEKSIVGIMEIVSAPYLDPKDDALIVVDVKPVARLPKPVSLQMIKGDKSFSDWELVRISRLSIMPVPDHLWKKILKMSGM